MNIEPYQPDRDREGVLAMLAEAPFFRAQFLAREAQGADAVFVARVDGVPAGLVSFAAGKYLRTRFTGYVAPAYRRRGIGGLLLRVMDGHYRESGWTERAAVLVPGAEDAAPRLLARHGFSRYCAQHVMERRGGPLPEGAFEIRPYADADYPAYAEIMADAFWNLREALRLAPNFYTPPNAEERRAFAGRAGDRFVLTDGGTVVAAASVRGNELATLAVRPDVRGYGCGTALAAHAVNEILSRGCDGATLHCVDGNPAFRLYQRLGFEDVGLECEYAKYYRPESRPREKP